VVITFIVVGLCTIGAEQYAIVAAYPETLGDDSIAVGAYIGAAACVGKLVMCVASLAAGLIVVKVHI
jgi:hypothetical protein